MGWRQDKDNCIPPNSKELSAGGDVKNKNLITHRKPVNSIPKIRGFLGKKPKR